MIRSAILPLSIRWIKNAVPSTATKFSVYRHLDNSERSLHSSFSGTIKNSKKIIIVTQDISRSPFLLFSTEANDNKGEEEVAPAEEAEVPTEEVAPEVSESGPVRTSEKDRSKVIPVETSMRYLKSDAYKQTYGDTPVWVLYRRNFKGQFAPKKTRRTCIRKDMISCGNPCPICRDEYLVLDYRNVDLLKQFISPYNGEILSYSKTGLCRTRQNQLLVEILKAKDYGTITFDVPFREYDYSEYEELYKSYKEL